MAFSFPLVIVDSLDEPSFIGCPAPARFIQFHWTRSAQLYSWTPFGFTLNNSHDFMLFSHLLEIFAARGPHALGQAAAHR